MGKSRGPLLTRVCLVCGGEFETTDRRKVYCQWDCANHGYYRLAQWRYRLTRSGDGQHARAAYVRAMKRDPCSFCTADAAAVDHIIPRTIEPSLHDNGAGVCRACNSAKHDDSLLLFMLRQRVRADMEPLVEEWRAITGNDPSARFRLQAEWG